MRAKNSREERQKERKRERERQRKKEKELTTCRRIVKGRQTNFIDKATLKLERRAKSSPIHASTSLTF